MSWVSAIAILFYFIFYPIVYLSYCVFDLVQILVTPFVNLGFGILNLTLLPLRILSRYEALFIFFTTALLTGMVLGLILHLTCTSIVETIHKTIGLAGTSSLQKLGSKPHSRQSRPAKRVKGVSLQDEPGSSSDYFTKWPGRRDMRLFHNAGLLSSTILEEEEFSQNSGGSQ